MKNFLTKTVLVITLASLLGACNTPPTKQDIGTISGGVAGGLLGSRFGGGSGQVLAIAAGTLLGAYVGGSIGKNMDDQDRAKANNALENNAIGQPAYWNNNKTGNNYTVTPTKNVTVDGNQYCREYRTVANVAGKPQQVYGTACREPDGTWQAAS